MNSWKVILGVVAVFFGHPVFAKRTSVPFLCDNIFSVLPANSVELIANEDRDRRQLQIQSSLGPQGLATIEKAIGASPFHKVQTEEEALAIFDKVASDPDAHQPIQEALSRLTDPQKWALYLITGFHAVSTHTDGHRSMVQQSVDAFPKAALFGGSSPHLLDVGIGNGNLIGSAMASNPRAMIMGLDVAGGSLSRSMDVLNSVADQIQAQHAGPRMFDYGRFGLLRGSAFDPQLLRGQQFDGISSVLTMFALPETQRLPAFNLMSNQLVPGGTMTYIDPTPEFKRNPREFLRTLVKDAYKNNEDLTALDVALLTVFNMGDFQKIHFLDPHEQRNLGIAAGLTPIGPSQPVYYGFANMTVFQKPSEHSVTVPNIDIPRLSPRPLAKADVASLEEAVRDEVARRTPGLELSRASSAQAKEVEDFIIQQRAKLGFSVPRERETDLKNIDGEFDAKGGFLYTLKKPSGEIAGTFAMVPTGHKTVEIRKMYFDDEFKGRGFGEHVLDGMIRFAAQRGYSEIVAETTPVLQSHQMFLRAGFSETERPAGTTDLVESNAIWLIKRLPQ
ncbi:GNAT family N-acetyltransferase [bacterium]|nr:GNAT family N-acetyltransferase [bacterium]